MRVLLFAVLATVVVAAYCCTPHTRYHADHEDVWGGGWCYCGSSGKVAACETVFRGVKFMFTQTSDEKRGNLAMCASDVQCHKVPLKTDLTLDPSHCDNATLPTSCSLTYEGLKYTFDLVEGNKLKNFKGVIDGVGHEVLPKMIYADPEGDRWEWY